MARTPGNGWFWPIVVCRGAIKSTVLSGHSWPEAEVRFVQAMISPSELIQAGHQVEEFRE